MARGLPITLKNLYDRMDATEDSIDLGTPVNAVASTGTLTFTGVVA